MLQSGLYYMRAASIQEGTYLKSIFFKVSRDILRFTEILFFEFLRYNWAEQYYFVRNH